MLQPVLEADFAKVNYPSEYPGMTRAESLAIASQAAGRCGIICSGGGTLPPKEFLQRLWEQMNTGNCRGAATGRNIHQKDTESAVKMTAACHAIICNGASVEEALKFTTLEFPGDLMGVIHPDITISRNLAIRILLCRRQI